MQGDAAHQLYRQLLHALAVAYRADRVHDGRFGAAMQVHIQNDGPVTIEIESPRVASASSSQEESKLVGVVHPLQE